MAVMPRSGEIFSRSPFSRRHGLRLVSAAQGSARVAMRVGRSHTQGLGRIHGGMVAALADTAATFAGYGALAEGESLLTSSMALSFTAGAAAGDDLVAEARVIHAGRTTIVAEATVRRGRRPPIATGLFTMIRLRERPAATRGAARSSRSRAAK